MFVHTLRVLSPTLPGWIPLSSHPSGAPSHPCEAGPGSGKIDEIWPLRGGLQVAGQANVQLTPKLAKKTISGWIGVNLNGGNHFALKERERKIPRIEERFCCMIIGGYLVFDALP